METHKAKAIAEYIVKYQNNSLTEQEWQALQEWINCSKKNQELFKHLSDKAYWKKLMKIDLEKEWLKVIDPDSARQVHVVTRNKVYRVAGVAASVALLVVVAGYLWLRKKEKELALVTQYIETKSATKPFLQLAGGSTIELNGSFNGPLARTFGQEVSNKNSEIRFDPILNSSYYVFNKYYYTEPLYNNSNTIITPKGNKYFITLPDGTKVALNGCSGIKFPSRFDPDKRVVEVSGNEVFFDVKPCYNKTTGQKIPFIIIKKEMEVYVTGTEFDIKSYNDGDSIKTTLVRGSVILKTNSGEYRLESGNAIVLNRNGKFSQQTTANLDEVIAWRVSASFDNVPMEEIMEHICRVFGTTVIYMNKSSKRFTTDIPATGVLATALKSVEDAGGVKFTIAGNDILVEFENQ